MRQTTINWLLPLLLMLLVALALTGCREDGSATGEVPGTLPPTGPPFEGDLEPTEVFGSLAGPAVECQAPGTELPAETVVGVTITDGDITLDTDVVPAGIIRFEVTNAGDVPHELLIVFSAEPEGLPVDDNGGVDESEIQPDTVKGEIESFPAGVTCPGTFQLPAGEYVLLCNIVEITEGKNLSHYERGERAGLSVE